ncbi:hypothetical protein PRIPAC_91657 [Pristionchus pacificus]|uniref:Uncharacterized protein n=1 Tax=Pristionchus pacificus TaxID=54126 RepID=A0A2A6CDK5_PRIPA|nr:hypothetical protein PRIPAC_91657 [Pristionchus pacificus]|eukprot:PDM76197.1 hypothetical protein PRIPAC_39801 [Pristionchus pacificus]
MREELEMLPHGQSVEEDVVLRAETDGAANLQHRERRTLAGAVVPEKSVNEHLEEGGSSNSFLKNEAPYVFDRPAMVTVASSFSRSSSYFKIGEIFVQLLGHNMCDLTSKMKNHAFCGTPSPPGFTASTYHVMMMKMKPSTCKRKRIHDHHMAQSERLVGSDALEDIGPVETTGLKYEDSGYGKCEDRATIAIVRDVIARRVDQRSKIIKPGRKNEPTSMICDVYSGKGVIFLEGGLLGLEISSEKTIPAAKFQYSFMIITVILFVSGIMIRSYPPPNTGHRWKFFAGAVIIFTTSIVLHNVSVE